MDDLVDLKGAIHVHSRYSDGSDGMEIIIAAAKAAGLDYVIVSDHNVLKAKTLGWEGWHDGVLVVVGCEISPPRSGHVLALNIHDCDGMKKMHPPDYLRKVREQGGVAFIAHPEGNQKREFNLNLPSWSHWDSPDYHGMEIWSYMHDWIDGCHLRNMLDYIRNPQDYITGPQPGILQLWDQLAHTRRIVGLGALDNHAANVPFRKFPWKLFKVFPHEQVFRTIRTHVLTPPLSRKYHDDTETFVDAITRGRCFIDYAPLGDGSGFRFTAVQNGTDYQMGGDLPAGQPVSFRVHCPRHAEIILLCDGAAELAVDGTELEHATDGRPGAYRVEARIDGKPWLFSNHIYVRAAKC
ncbi:MAG TPA: CehA/McbA family metallohydrolase [Planctomycetota bacterium]|nr:CehA/McbA family metallohydrolase [Planctomycetota bacterium]